MAVVFDALTDYGISHNSVTSFTDTRHTVGSGSNRALIVALSAEATLPTAPTCNWDSAGTNQSMTAIASIARSTSTKTWLFCLVAPTSGAKTLNVASLGTAADVIVAYISFTGADQTGGTTTFKNAISSTATETTNTKTVTTVSGDGVVGMFSGNDGTPTVNQTAWTSAAVTTASIDFHIGNFAIAAGATTVMSMTQTSAPDTGVALAINQAVIDVLQAQIML